MTENVEKFDTSRMEILSEFPVKYDNDEEITKPQDSDKAKIYIASLNENVVIAYQSRKTGRIVSDIVFEKDSILSVGKGVNEVLEKDEPWKEPVEYEKGRDNVLITYSSSFGHDVVAPLERVNVYNRRNYELDGLRAQDMWLSLPPRMAKKLADETEKLFG